jgi:GNAT superfamily N-acetyltransferase
MRLTPFTPEHASLVAGWASTREDQDRWASLAEAATPATFETWHADTDTHPRLLIGEAPLAYGELWLSTEEDEVELGRLLVAPDGRGQGVGQALVKLLVAEAKGFQVSTAWVRFVPENEAAHRCYAAAGFSRASTEVESAFNAIQPRPYCWLSLPL